MPRTCSSGRSRCCPPRTRGARRLLIELIGTLEGAAQPEDQFRRIEELEQSADPIVRMHGRVARLQLRLLTDPADVVAEADRAIEEALALFGGAGDELGLAHTHYLVAWINWLQSRAAPTQAAYEHIIRHARKSNSRALLGRAMIQQMGPLYYGPFTVDEIRTRLAELEIDDSMLARIVKLSIEADLAQRAGRFDECLAIIDDVAALHADLGVELGTVITMQRRAETLADADRLDEAAAAFRKVLERLDALGMTSFRSTTMINYAMIVYQLGDVDEAERLAIEGEEIGAVEDVSTSPRPGLRARISADRGDPDGAERLARSAVCERVPDRLPVGARGGARGARTRPERAAAQGRGAVGVRAGTRALVSLRLQRSRRTHRESYW